MTFKPTRLAMADWVIGISAIALMIDLFAVPWFAYRPEYQAIAIVLARRVNANGWQAFTFVGPFTLLVAVAGIAVFWLQGTRRSPALPVVVTTLLAPVSLALVVLLAVRVLLDQPSVPLAGGGSAIEARPGAYFAVILSSAIFVGVYLSLRREGVAAEDAPTEMEVLAVGDPI